MLTSPPGCAWPGRPTGSTSPPAITDDVLVGNDSPQIWGDDVIELSVRIRQHDPPVHPGAGRPHDRQRQPHLVADLSSPAPSSVAGPSKSPSRPPALGLAELEVDQQYPFTFGLWDDDTPHLPRPDPPDLARHLHHHLPAGVGHAHASAAPSTTSCKKPPPRRPPLPSCPPHPKRRHRRPRPPPRRRPRPPTRLRTRRRPLLREHRRRHHPAT